MTTLSQPPVFDAEDLIDDGDMRLLRALPLRTLASIGPFVFIDHYRHSSRRGLGDRPHPHAGIEVISYLLEGSVRHRDSMGNSDTIKAGEVQVISAGSGMLHVEEPLSGRHGLQMWTALPPLARHTPPTYHHFGPSHLRPERQDDGSLLCVISGRVNELKGPVMLARESVLAHISLAAGRARSFKFDDGLQVAAYVLDGGAVINGRSVGIGQLVPELASGCDIHATESGRCDVIFFGGTPISEPVLFAGPFVMDNEADLAIARARYLTGAMGTLDGTPF